MRTSTMISQNNPDSTNFLVEYLSPIALMFSVRSYQLLSGITCDYGKNGRGGGRLEITIEKYAMDIHGYEVGTETCVFCTPLIERVKLGAVFGVPTIVEPYCINPYAFRICNYSIPKKASAVYYPTTREDFLEELDNVIEKYKKNMPKATFDTKSRTWFIGDYGFSLETGQPV